jgi:hypothetical protein
LCVTSCPVGLVAVRETVQQQLVRLGFDTETKDGLLYEVKDFHCDVKMQSAGALLQKVYGPWWNY